MSKTINNVSVFRSLISAATSRKELGEMTRAAADAIKENAKLASDILSRAGVPLAQLDVAAEQPKQFVRASFKAGAPEGRQAKENALKAYALFSQWAAKPAAVEVMRDLCAAADVKPDASKDDWNSGRQRLNTVLRAIMAAVAGTKPKTSAERISDLAKKAAKLVKDGADEAAVVKAIRQAIADIGIDS